MGRDGDGVTDGLETPFSRRYLVSRWYLPEAQFVEFGGEG